MNKIMLMLAILSATPLTWGQELNIYRSIEIELTTESGIFYQLETSNDLKTWQATGEPFLGRGHAQSQFLRIEDRHLFYRARPTAALPKAEDDGIFQHSTLGALLVGVELDTCSRLTTDIPDTLDFREVTLE